MDGINENDRVNADKAAVLPFLNVGQNLIGYVGYKSFRCLKTVDVIDRFGNLSRSHSLGIHGYDFLINRRDILLPLFYHLWFKRRLPVLGDFNPNAPIAAV